MVQAWPCTYKRLEQDQCSPPFFCLLQVSSCGSLLPTIDTIEAESTTKMKWTSVRTLALVVPVQAGLRFQCSTLTIQRLDPVVQPGESPSSHLHHIVGGNAFNASMEGDVATRATCTTCEMSEDFSNYWTATLFFKHQNGSYHRVPVIPVNPGNLDGYSGTQGGLTVYYTQTDLLRDSIATNPVKTFQPVIPSHPAS